MSISGEHVLVLRHVPFEDLGTLEDALRARSARITQVDAPLVDFSTIDPLAPDVLIVLGGPISANDDRTYPFLAAELRLLEARLQADLPTLGICLGSQLIARALGANVYSGRRKEIGWGAISLSPEGLASPLRHLENIDILHWHGDTFDLPDGAQRLASNDLYENQAFSIGRALALQFHVEVARLEPWLVGHAVELGDSGVDVRVLRDDSIARLPALRCATDTLLGDWLSGVTLASTGHAE